MIGFIKGRVDTIGSNYAFVETQGVGYRIYMNTSDLGRMVLDDKVKVYTYLAVREDALTLYGFLSQEAYGLFTKLITVRNPFRVKGGRFPACHQESGCEIPDQASRHWKKDGRTHALGAKGPDGTRRPAARIKWRLPRSRRPSFCPDGNHGGACFLRVHPK